MGDCQSSIRVSLLLIKLYFVKYAECIKIQNKAGIFILCHGICLMHQESLEKGKQECYSHLCVNWAYKHEAKRLLYLRISEVDIASFLNQGTSMEIHQLLECIDRLEDHKETYEL